MKNGFPKAARLLRKADFRRVYSANRRIYGPSIILEYRFGRSTTPRLGITVSRKYGKAHVRNKFKRIIRESFRTSHFLLPTNLEINIRPKKRYNEEDINKLASEVKKILETSFITHESYSSKPQAVLGNHRN